MNTNTTTKTIHNLQIETIKKDIKNIHLAVYPPQGRIRLATPLATTDEQIELFILTKLPWIKKQQQKFQNQNRQTKRDYITGESHYLFGKRYLLNIHTTNEKPKIEINRLKKIDFHITENSTTKQRHHLMQEWYRTQLKEHAPKHIDKWQQKTGIHINEWRIKQMKTKWGTCNPQAKRIWLNLELAKKPPECLDYIILHELIHILERTHNQTFQDYMNHYMPNWQTNKEKLNQFPISHQDWGY